jgi:hypothetical protein
MICVLVDMKNESTWYVGHYLAYCTSLGWCMMISVEHSVELVDGGIRSTRRKPASVPICPPQIPHDLIWDQTWATEVGNQLNTGRTSVRNKVLPVFNWYTRNRMHNPMIKMGNQFLTTWVMAQPLSIWKSKDQLMEYMKLKFAVLLNSDWSTWISFGYTCLFKFWIMCCLISVKSEFNWDVNLLRVLITAQFSLLRDCVGNSTRDFCTCGIFARPVASKLKKGT